MQIHVANFGLTQTASSYYGIGSVTPLPRLGEDFPSNRIQEADTCPRCGQPRGRCNCDHEDTARISDEAYERYARYRSEEAQRKAPHKPEVLQSSGSQETPSTQPSEGPLPEVKNPSQAEIPAAFPVDEDGTNHQNAHDHAQEQDQKGQQEQSAGSAQKSATGEPLSEEEEKEVQELEQRDREVRTHEQAHLAAAGHLASGGPSFEYEKGPNGKQYATGGEVNISVGGGNTPEERLRNAEQAERAALAPAEPSSQDRKVAAEARKKANNAKQEIQEEKSPSHASATPGANANQGSEAVNSASEDNNDLLGGVFGIAEKSEDDSHANPSSILFPSQIFNSSFQKGEEEDSASVISRDRRPQSPLSRAASAYQQMSGQESGGFSRSERLDSTFQNRNRVHAFA